MATILTSPFFVNYILPFVLVFTVVFAILQKSKILGDGKKQIDSLVALVIGLIVISFRNAVGIINSLLPFFAVAMVIILVFLLLMAMVFSDLAKGLEIDKKVKWTITILAGISVIVASLVITGAWDYMAQRWFSEGGDTDNVTSVVFIIIIIAAVAFALVGKKESKS